MPADLVNLDAPTLRQDFAITRDEVAAAGQSVDTSSVSERNSQAVVRRARGGAKSAGR